MPNLKKGIKIKKENLFAYKFISLLFYYNLYLSL
jgi:hypothetical protein